VYVHAEKRKLDLKAISIILVGYDDKSKEYRCYNLITQKIVVNRDAKFHIKEEMSEVYTKEKFLGFIRRSRGSRKR